MARRPVLRSAPFKQLGLSQLKGFCEVCRLGSYAAASRLLLLTSAAIWEQVKGLERHYGVVLLERRGDRMQPTLHGRRLIKLITPILAELDSIDSVFRQNDGIFPERIRLVTNLRVLIDEVSQAMVLFRGRFPSVRLAVAYTRIDEVETLVLEGSADVALTLEPMPDQPISDQIVFEKAGELDYLLVAPPGHPLLKTRSFRLDSLTKYPLVLADRTAYSRRAVDEVLRRHGLLSRIQINCETNGDAFTLACVKAGLGVGIAAGNPSSDLYRDLGVRVLSHWFGVARVGFFWRQGAHIPPVQLKLADLLREQMRTGC